MNEQIAELILKAWAAMGVIIYVIECLRDPIHRMYPPLSLLTTVVLWPVFYGGMLFLAIKRKYTGRKNSP